ncbi:P-loop NTPase fold protein [Agarivorans gilvus]|uniref:AAA+ ATPase domain-containing protein n=1 Tax=Agarivorans gilvus TaxID=680279 RepID=A0ABQ1I6D9_9ALTE|nr:P-loop NTPase fold protein [Agarivorans gilvus]GGB21183.1 hypothetical protein GCM10007414_38220 [Agarivorans gilvus]
MSHKDKQALALEKFTKLISQHREDLAGISSANEATTRLLIIDDILAILGWKKTDYNPEKWLSNAGFTDYLLTSKGTPRLVVEAKKTGQTFKSLTKNTSKTDYEIRYLRRSFKKPFSDVIQQATNYCVESKVPFALITNGAEWVALQLIPSPGTSLDSSKAIYFGNVFSESFEFDLFWSLLSKESFDDLRLEGYLANINYQQAEVSKVLRSDYSELQWRVSRPEEYLSEFYENFFSKITEPNQRRMLEYCFVSDSKLDQYRGDLKRLLKDSKPTYMPSNTEDCDPGAGKDSILKDGKSGQVVIITGSVGCGKSTLVTKCLVEARQQKEQLAHTILIDLINEVSRQDIDARSVIYDRIYEYLTSQFDFVFELDYLRKIYARELRSYKESSYKEYFKLNPNAYIKHEADLLDEKIKDREKFVFAALKQLTSDNNSVIVILDNVDRAHERFQEEMYALCHDLAGKTGAKTIITLREFTFFKNKKSGFLDVRPEDRVIHLKAPNFGKLVSQRIKYIESKVDQDFRTKDWRKQFESYDDFLNAIKVHASALKRSLQVSDDAHNILETLSSISWHNVRYFYDLLRRIHRQLGSGSYTWKNKEVIAALMASTEAGESPIIPNIFVPNPSSSQSYFIKIRLISYLSTLKAGEVTNGVPLNRVVDFLRLYGYQRIWIHSSIEESVKQKLVECLEIPSENESLKGFTLDMGGTYRLSPLGLLFLNQIVRDKTYRSLISVTLPIHSSCAFDEFRNEFMNVNSYMSDTNEYLLFREGLDIVLGSKLCCLTESYFVVVK